MEGASFSMIYLIRSFHYLHALLIVCSCRHREGLDLGQARHLDSRAELAELVGLVVLVDSEQSLPAGTVENSGESLEMAGHWACSVEEHLGREEGKACRGQQEALYPADLAERQMGAEAFLTRSQQKCVTYQGLHTRKTHRWKSWSGACLLQHRIGLSFRSIGIRDRINNGLCLFVSNLLVVFCDVSQVVATSVMRLSNRHGVMREVDIAIIAEEFRHFVTIYVDSRQASRKSVFCAEEGCIQ